MRLRPILALAAAVLAAGTAAAQGAPLRPELPRDADPNDWAAYYFRGTELLRSVPREGDHYLYWAQRLNPARAEPLYARWVAYHLQNLTRLEGYMRDDERVISNPEVIRADSLLLLAQIRNPFLHRGLMILLYEAMPGEWGRDMYTRGLLQYSSGKLDEAVYLFSEYLQRNPRDLGARWSLALSLVASGKMDSAQVVMDTLVARLRQREETRVVRVYNSKEMQEYASGLLALSRNHPEQARTAMEQALVENAATWYAHSGRALALRVEGRPDEAVQEMAAAQELAPEDAVLRHDYGTALLEAGQTAEAIVQFRRAVELEPYWSEAWASLGDAERAAGNTASAIKAYEQYLALAPRRAAPIIAGVRQRLAELRQAPAPAAPATPAP